MTNKLVSIIMPIYNEEKYLEQAIQSVKNQTYTNWELICIDDCSTDKSVEILEKYECDNIKVALLSQNYGSNVARNKGIEIAKGRYIAFLDGDDYYHKEKLEKQVKFLEENNYGITYTGYAMVYKDKKTKNIKVPQKLNYISYMKNTMITTLGVMIDTEKIPKEELYMEDSKLAEDTKTWLRILRKGEIAYGINEVLGYYRQGKNSKSHNKIKAAKYVWELYQKEDISKLKASYYFLCYAYNAIKKRL